MPCTIIRCHSVWSFLPGDSPWPRAICDGFGGIYHTVPVLYAHGRCWLLSSGSGHTGSYSNKGKFIEEKFRFSSLLHS